MSKLEKNRSSNYEILCIMRECNHEQKNEFVERIRKTALLEDFATKSETKNLAYPIEKINTAEYLLFNLRTDHQRVIEMKEVLKNPLVIRYMIINLDTEKRIKIKNFDKLRRNRKFKKMEFGAENPLREKFGKKPSQPQQVNEVEPDQPETEIEN